MDIRLQRIDPLKLGKLLFEIDNAAFNRPFDLKARNVQEEINYLKDSEVFILYVDKNPVGFISYKNLAKFTEIMTIAVLPEHQQKGYAKKMLTEMLKMVKNKEINLVTHPKNIPAIILYLKLGFEIYGIKDNYYGDGNPRLLLRKYL